MHVRAGCPQFVRMQRPRRRPGNQPLQSAIIPSWRSGITNTKATIRFSGSAKCPAGQEHSWSAQLCSRTGRQQTGCPFCAGHAACRCNTLQALYPDTAEEWDHSKNEGQPREHTATSTYLAWWFSPQRGSWQQTINAQTLQVQQRTTSLKRVQEQKLSVGRSTIAKLWPERAYDPSKVTRPFHCACQLCC